MERLIKTGKVDFKNTEVSDCTRIGVGLEKLDRALYYPDRAYDKIAAIGVHWVRIQSGWMRTEKTPGVYDFSWIDDIVDNLLARKMQPWICLCYGNPLYSGRAKKTFGAVGCPPVEGEYKAAWLRYVVATVKHFAGRVTLYEIWNEPDCSYSWKHEGYTKENDPGISGKEYGLLARDTAIVIHEADKNAKAVAFGMGKPSLTEYLDDAFGIEGFAESMDYATFHAYIADDTKRTAHYKPFADKCRENSIKMIHGEGGTQSRSDGAGALKGMAWTEEKQVKYLLRAITRDLHEPEMYFTSYFSTMDMVEALHGVNGDTASYLDYGYFGILGAQFDENGISVGEYKPKPSYTALGTLISIFYGEYSPCSENDIGLSRRVFASRRVAGYDCNDACYTGLAFSRPDGSAAYVYFNATKVLTSTYEGTVSFRLPSDFDKEIHLVDLADGSIYDLPESMYDRTKEKESLILLNIPITDSPMMLTFGDFIK